MTTYFPDVTTPTTTSLASLIDIIERKMQNWALFAQYTERGDGETYVFRLYRGATINGSVVVKVDGVVQVAPTQYTVDYEAGLLTFVTAPPDGAVIFISYQFKFYSQDDILDALNQAVVDVWAEIPPVSADTTTITGLSPGTYEYSLPDDCERIIRVEYRPTEMSMYELVTGWRVVRNGFTKMLKLLSPQPTGTYRLHYVASPGQFTSIDDSLEGATGLPASAKWAVIYLACFYMLEDKLLSRVRTNQFKNAEGVNVPKIYEVQRVAADFRTLADVELRKLRIGPKRFS